MTMRPISLSVKRSTHRADDPEREHADKSFSKVRLQVKERDAYSCVFCGFKSNKHQEVHHLDDDHHNNSAENLATTCVLCHAAFHVGFSGAKNRGSLIYLDPDLGVTQAGLNCLVRNLWIAEDAGDKSQRLTAMSYLTRLDKQKIAARRQIGTSDLKILADFILFMTDEDYALRDAVLKGHYFLPAREAFEPQIEYWKQTVYKPLPPTRWAGMARKQAEKWMHTESDDHSDLADMLGVET